MKGHQIFNVMKLFLISLGFLAVVIFLGSILLIILAIYRPYHEERYTLINGKPETHYNNPKYGVSFFQIDNVKIYTSLSPTNCTNKGVYNWEKAIGPYEFSACFHNYGSSVKSILIKDIIIKSSSSKSVIDYEKELNHKIVFPVYDNIENINQKDSKYIQIRTFRLKNLINLTFKSGDNIEVTMKFNMFTDNTSSKYEIESLFAPKLIKGYIQIEIP